MKFIHFVAIVAAFIFTGCQPTSTATNIGATPASGTETTDATATSAPGNPKANFLAAFRQATIDKDVEKMLQLYCLDGVDAEMRGVVRENVTAEVQHPVTELKMIEPATGDHGPRVEGGVRWKPNLPVVGLLKAKFAKAPEGSGWSVAEAEYAVGIKDGQYRIVMSIRE